jgi:hypothetical protein
VDWCSHRERQAVCRGVRGDLSAFRNAGNAPGATHISNTQNISGDFFGTANQGQEISSTNNIASTAGIDAAQLEVIFDQLRATLENLRNLDGEVGVWAREEAEGVEYVLDELKQEMSKDTPDQEKVRKQGNMLRRLTGKMAKGAATKVDGAVATTELGALHGQVHQLLQLLGLS